MARSTSATSPMVVVEPRTLDDRDASDLLRSIAASALVGVSRASSAFVTSRLRPRNSVMQHHRP